MIRRHHGAPHIASETEGLFYSFLHFKARHERKQERRLCPAASGGQQRPREQRPTADVRPRIPSTLRPRAGSRLLKPGEGKGKSEATASTFSVYYPYDTAQCYKLLFSVYCLVV